MGLSQANTSIGSCLQTKKTAHFQHGEDCLDLDWPDTSYWIIARELLLFETIDLSEVPLKQRAKVVEQKVRLLSPFSETGHYVHQSESKALVWIWDERLRREALDKVISEFSILRDHLSRLVPVPETLFYVKKGDGQYEVGCVSGTDQQQWRRGVLESSLWSPSESVKTENLSPHPWLESQKRTWDEQLLLRGVAGLLILLFAFQLGGVLGWRYQINGLESRLIEVDSKISESLSVRDKARSIKRLNTLLDYVRKPRQIDILAEVDVLLPATTQINVWDFQNGELELTVEDPELDNRRYIEALDQSSMFGDVRVQPGTVVNTAVISLRVRTR